MVIDISHTTVNRNLAALRSMFNRARKWKWTRNNPLDGVEFSREKPGDGHVYTPEEERRLLEVADKPSNKSPFLAPVIIIALHTGMRRGEIFRMTWGDINFSDGSIRIPDTKNREVRYAHMNAKVLKALKEWKMRGVTGRNIWGVQDCKRAWNEARRITRLPYRFHDLRHTFASRLARSGVAQYHIQKLAGHR